RLTVSAICRCTISAVSPRLCTKTLNCLNLTKCTSMGISKEDADYKFGFIINAFKFGAPPHGGLAFGFDRVCALFGGQETIRDFIAFPKNNMGRDVMIDSPSRIDQVQMDELFLSSTAPEPKE
ncbi:MAG: hypothetical protein IIU16_01035, partial [Bacteroidales bacterium]|nr:hypothetical protein [Bacteroidales bacterium]